MSGKKMKQRFPIHIIVIVLLLVASFVVIPANALPMLGEILFPYAVSEDGSTTLILYKHQPSDNAVFQVENMFPGDSVTQEYCVRVACENEVTMQFSIEVKEGYEKLAEVLHCGVVFLGTGEVLYNGPMANAIETFDHNVAGGETAADLKYAVTVYMDTSVGNAYQNQKLVADFVWYADGELGEVIEDPPVPGGLLPQTGDSVRLGLGMIMMAISFVAIILLVVKGRKGGRYA